MLGSKSAQAIEDMVGYAQETQHEKILRGLAVGIAMVMYGRMEEADALIESLCRDKVRLKFTLSYIPGCFTLQEHLRFQSLIMVKFVPNFRKRTEKGIIFYIYAVISNSHSEIKTNNKLPQLRLDADCYSKLIKNISATFLILCVWA